MNNTEKTKSSTEVAKIITEDAQSNTEVAKANEYSARNVQITRNVLRRELPIGHHGLPIPVMSDLPLEQMLQDCRYPFVYTSMGASLGKKEVVEALYDLAHRDVYRPHDRIYMIQAFTRDAAELCLLMATLNPVQAQRYFIFSGPNQTIAYYGTHYPATMNAYITLDDLFNFQLAETTVRYTASVPNTGEVYYDLPLSQTPLADLGSRPLLRLVSYFNNMLGNEQGVAAKICAENGIDPIRCNASSFGIHQFSPVQFSNLDNQYSARQGTYWVQGENSAPYYRIEHVGLTDGRYAFLPLRYVCKPGCQFTKPMFLPPEEPRFVNEWQIGDQSRPLVITSHMEMINNSGHVQNPQRRYNLISDYDMAGNIDRLPWGLMRGMTVYYLLLYNETTRREELDLAIKVCAKIRDAGYGHPRIIDCGGWVFIPEQAEVFTDQEFGRLLEKHGLAIDLCGFKDYERPKTRLPSEPTAVPYVKTTELFLVVGEPKAGKTWSLLHHLLQIAFQGDKPARALYVYGEGEKAQIEKMIRTLAAAMGICKGTPRAIQLLDARDVLGEGDGVFDLIDAQCGAGLVERIKYEKEQARGYPLRAVGFDNYASLAGKGQVGDAAAVSALRTLGKVQNLGIAVFLACHTNREGLVAASEQFERRANGSILVTKKAPWQEELEQQWLARTKKVKPDAEEVRDMLINEIEEASRFRDCITAHISFQRFRGEQPDGYEMQIQLSAPSLLITPVTPEIKKAFVDELANQGSAPQMESVSESERVRAVSGGPSLSDLDTMAADERIQRLAEIVREGALQTRAELAEILVCSESSLDRRMSDWTIANKDIGLQDRRGRKAKNE